MLSPFSESLGGSRMMGPEKVMEGAEIGPLHRSRGSHRGRRSLRFVAVSISIQWLGANNIGVTGGVLTSLGSGLS